jgi:inner membrane transporter RhtA
VPAPVLVIGAIASVQLGGAFAKTLFDEIGPGGTVWLRIVTAALVLAAVWRPRARGLTRDDLLLVLAFALSLAGMNFAFYSSLDRIPLGVAVTYEFVGPLGVALIGSRRALDLLWVALAAGGILLLSDFGATDLDTTGVALALLAGGFWAAYILLSVRIGRRFEGGDGLALAMVVAAAMLMPVGIADGAGELLSVHVLAVGVAVGLLSSAIPYSLELEALRRLPSGVFGVLMSLEPAMAALAGFIVLGEDLAARELAAIGLVVVASAGAAMGARVTLRDA